MRRPRPTHGCSAEEKKKKKKKKKKNPSGHTAALGLTQPLKEMSTRNISWEVDAASA